MHTIYCVEKGSKGKHKHSFYIYDDDYYFFVSSKKILMTQS